MASIRLESVKHISFVGPCLCVFCPSLPRADKPNVLIILADDQSARHIGAVDPAIHTPNLDRLVEKGVLFENCYIQGGTTPAVCTPSRAMLMTGRNLFHLPQDIYAAGNNPSLPVMSTVLATAGYDTFYCGKHGNTYRPGDKSFQKFTAINRVQRQNRDVAAETAENHGFTEPVLSYLADPARAEKPFFIFYAPSVPHDPVTPEPQDLERYSGDNLPLLPPNAATSHAAITGFNMRDTNIRTFDFPGLGHFNTPLSLDQFRSMTAWYHAYITSFDRQLGRILDELERTGADENTIIVFTADNGMSVGQQGLIHKQSVYEQDIHVPLIICGPGIPQGQRSEALVDLADLFPTLCGKLDIATPATVQTKSFLPSLTDPTLPHHTSMYHGYREEMRALRDGNYKICLFSNGHVRLFDIAADPHEINDLSKEPGQAQRVAEMIEQARQTGQTLDDHPDNMPPAFARDQQPFWESFDSHSFDKTIAWSSKPYTMGGGMLKNVMGVDQFDQSGTKFLAVNVGGTALNFTQATHPTIAFTASDANLDTSSLTTAAAVFFNSTSSSNNALANTAKYNGTPGPNVITLNNLTMGKAYRIQALVADHRALQTGRRVFFDGVAQGRYANGVNGVTHGDSLLMTGIFVADNTGTQSFTVQTTAPDGTTLAGGQLNALLVYAIEGYAGWILKYPDVGVLSGFNDDFDNDGHSNGVEYFFGTDPSVFTIGLVAGELSGNTLTFTHPLNATPAGDISASYRWSADLGTFHADGESAGGTTVTFTQGAPSGGMVTVMATITGTGVDRLFVKVGVRRN